MSLLCSTVKDLDSEKYFHLVSVPLLWGCTVGAGLGRSHSGQRDGVSPAAGGCQGHVPLGQHRERGDPSGCGCTVIPHPLRFSLCILFFQHV